MKLDLQLYPIETEDPNMMLKDKLLVEVVEISEDEKANVSDAIKAKGKSVPS